MKRFKFIRLISIIMFVVVLLPLEVFATIPRIGRPTQYQEIRPGSNLTLLWAEPSIGTVEKYIVSVRKFRNLEYVVTNSVNNYDDPLIVNNYETTVLSYTIGSNNLEPGSKYRCSICAVMSDGTRKYSKEVYFYVSKRRGIESLPVSFNIYSGFSDQTKSAIYYACQTWNNALDLGYEVVNTYPFSMGISNDYFETYDGVNAITGVSEPGVRYLMQTTSWKNSDYMLLEADINVNTAKIWANSAQAGKYDVQSSMTHEMGHVVSLVDKYDSWASEWTMYGEAETNSIDMRSLEEHDIVTAQGRFD